MNDSGANSPQGDNYEYTYAEIQRLRSAGKEPEAHRLFTTAMAQKDLLFHPDTALRAKFLNLIRVFPTNERAQETQEGTPKTQPKWMILKNKLRVREENKKKFPETPMEEEVEDDEEMDPDVLFRFFEVYIGVLEAAREEHAEQMVQIRKCLSGLTDEHPKEEILERIAPLTASPPPGPLGISLLEFFVKKGWLSSDEEDMEPDEDELRRIEAELDNGALP